MRELTIFLKDNVVVMVDVPQDDIVEIVNMIEKEYPDNLGYQINIPKELVLKK